MEKEMNAISGEHFLKRIALLYTLPLLLFIVGIGAGNYVLFFVNQETKEFITLIASLLLMVGTFTLLLRRYSKKNKNRPIDTNKQ